MRGWGAGVRAAARIARRDAARAKGRTALIAAMVGLPVLVGSAGGVLLQSGVPAPSRYAQQQLGDLAQARIGPFESPTLEQNARGEGWGNSESTSPEAPAAADYEADLTAALPAGDALVRTTQGFARVATADIAPSASVQVSEFASSNAALASRAPLADGVLPTGPGEVALSVPLAQRLSVQVGDTIAVTPVAGKAIDTTITGLLAVTAAGPAVVAAPGAIFASPGTARSATTWSEWYITGPAPVTWSDVRAINAIGSVVVSRSVIVDPPLAATAFNGTSGPTGGTLALFAAVAAMALLEAVLLIGPAFAVGARRDERQLALIAAGGGDRRTLRQVVLLRAVGIGAAASVVAVVAGVGLAAAIRAVVRSRGAIEFPDLRIPAELPLLIVLGTLIAAAAGWMPARRAARVDVVAALAGRRAEARARHGVPIVGVVFFGLGVAAAFVGATLSQPTVLVGGVLALEIGLIAASGGLVTLVGRLAPRAGVAGRIAMRDAARQRGRSVPAIAAVIAAMAGVVAGAIYTQSDEAQQAAQYAPMSAVGVVTVGLEGEDSRAETAEQYGAAERAVRARLPVTDVHQVQLAAFTDPAAPAQGSLFTELPPENTCPLDSGEPLTGAARRTAGADPRCGREHGGTVVWSLPQGAMTTLVDDGTILQALDLPGSADAAKALRQGKVVVSSRNELWPDGTTHLHSNTEQDPTTGELVNGETVVLPAVAVDLSNSAQYGIVLPPSVLPELGLRPQLAGLVATGPRAPTQHEEDRATSDLGDTVPVAHLVVERGFTGQQPLVLWILVAAAVVVGLGATGISVALAAAESRPDLATLGAVGASPAMRRRVAAAQAGVIAVVGVGVGVVTGLMLGRVLVLAERYRYEIVNLDWQVVTPWPAIAAIAFGVPFLAIAGGYLLTRSRLPMVRRIAG